MKKNELKIILKPLIKECIKEVIFEEGVLSGIIAEVLKGSAPLLEKQQLTEHKKPEVETNYRQPNRDEELEARLSRLRETKEKILTAVGEDSYNGVDLFEGTVPMRAGNGDVSSPLNAYGPNDSGVDIGKIFSSRWKNLI